MGVADFSWSFWLLQLASAVLNLVSERSAQAAAAVVFVWFRCGFSCVLVVSLFVVAAAASICKVQPGFRKVPTDLCGGFCVEIAGFSWLAVTFWLLADCAPAEFF